MEDSSSTSSDSDNILLAPKDHEGRNATTQTPETARHELAPPASEAITVYKLDPQKPLSELEQEARNLAIPDVVVEYIKGSYQGETNQGFEAQELIVVRTPSSLSLRDDLQCEKGQLGDQLQVGLQLQIPSRTGSTISLRCPSPSFGYRPLESETSAVYTILAPVKYVQKETEMRLLAQLQAQLEKEKALARKFEFCPAPLAVERKRHRLQSLTDICSTLFLVPGIFIAIVAPVTLIPMFIMPLKFMLPLMALFVVCGCSAVVLLAVSGFIGNVVWHYDDRTQKLRPRLHCGTGPLKHFWGDGFYPIQKENVLQDGEKV